MLIIVTQQHIEAGKSCRAAECPVALAMRDAGFPDAHVDFGRVWVSHEDRLANYNRPLAFLPTVASVWISNF
jgi:hypothetical protein